MTIKHHFDSLLVLLSFDPSLLTIFHEFHRVFLEVVVVQVLGKQIRIVVLTFNELDLYDSIFDVVLDEMVTSVDVFRPRCG